jgi:2-succinyl-5-enolpyruvyl-6-hydroxy-3-cyclohexene-1-carboxylate synthase
VVALAAAHGIDAATVTTAAELTARLARRGPSVTRVPTDRAENVRVHAALNEAVAAALDGVGSV